MTKLLFDRGAGDVLGHLLVLDLRRRRVRACWFVQSRFTGGERVYFRLERDYFRDHVSVALVFEVADHAGAGRSGRRRRSGKSLESPRDPSGHAAAAETGAPRTGFPT